MTSDPTPQQVLTQAADLVEKGWCQKTYATDDQGKSVDYAEDSAVCFCVLGAIKRVSGLSHIAQIGAVNQFKEVVGRVRLAGWNDNPKRTQAQVVNALRKAAELEAKANSS